MEKLKLFNAERITGINDKKGMTHDEPCFSLFTDNRQNLLRRALCACASAEALGDFGGFFTIGGVGKHFVNRFPDGCGFRLVELRACAKLKHARGKRRPAPAFAET